MNNKVKVKKDRLGLILLWPVGILFISIGLLFSCGFIDNSSSKARFLDSENDEDSAESAGVFNSPEGRLDSSDKCFRNDACVELCGSMLESFKDQKKCYDHTEMEVQAFRDVYNLLALGNSRKLEQVEPKAMEDFLAFGPALWRDAVYGFERGRKENCEVNDGSNDPREREDCRFEDYYKQSGYDGEGASTGLSWIARNNWLADLVDEYDEDEEIMKALLDILANGVQDADREEDDNTKCQVDSGDSFSYPDPPELEFSFNLEADLKLYQTFGNSECVDEKSYFHLAHEEENDAALLIGYEVLKYICKKADTETGNACEIHFFCNIENQEAILSYINNKRLYQGFDIDQVDCGG